jgi:hypothetical protein
MCELRVAELMLVLRAGAAGPAPGISRGVGAGVVPCESAGVSGTVGLGAGLEPGGKSGGTGDFGLEPGGKSGGTGVLGGFAAICAHVLGVVVDSRRAGREGAEVGADASPDVAGAPPDLSVCLVGGLPRGAE